MLISGDDKIGFSATCLLAGFCLTGYVIAGTTTFTYDWEFAEGVWEGEPTFGYAVASGAGFDARVSHGTSDNAGDLDYSVDPNNPVFYSVDPDPVDPQFNRHILELTETTLGDPAGNFYGVLAYVEHLSDGDLVSFSFAGYIPTAGGVQYVVPDAHYSESGRGPAPPGPNNFLGAITPQPQPLGGGGWVELHFDGALSAGTTADPIVFDSTQASNPGSASALTLRVRGVSPLDALPAGSTDDDYNFYVDHLAVTVTSNNPNAQITLPSLRTFPVNLPLCDFGGGCTLSDMDALVAEIVAGTNDTVFDVNGDGLVDQADLEPWLALAGNEHLPSGGSYLFGDVDLDGTVDGTDFITWNDHKFTTSGLWSLADFNADGVTDGLDFVEWNNNKFTSADAGGIGPAVVPEPDTWLLMALACLRMRRRDRMSGNVTSCPCESFGESH